MSAPTPPSHEEDDAPSDDHERRVELHAVGTMTLDEAKHVARLARSVWLRWLPLLVLVAGTTWVLVLAALSTRTGGTENLELFLGIVGAVWAYALIARWLLPARKQKQRCLRRAGIFAYRELVISVAGIESRTNHGASSHPWRSFSKFVADDRMVVLFLQRTTHCVPVPRSFFATDDDWRKLQQIVARKLPRA